MNYRDDNERRQGQYGGQRDWQRESDSRSRAGRSRGGQGQQEAFQQRGGGQQGGYDPQDDVIYGYGSNHGHRSDNDFGGGGGQQARRGQGNDDRAMGYGHGRGYEGSGGHGRGYGGSPGQQGHGYEGRDSWRTHGGFDSRDGGWAGRGSGSSDLSDYGSNAPGAPWQTTPGARQYERHDMGGGFDQGRFQTSGRQGQGRGDAEHRWDPHYHQWREEQMRRLDEDYSAYNRERYQKFADDFDSWRSQRANASRGGGVGSGGTSNPTASGERSQTSGASGNGGTSALGGAAGGGKPGESKQQG